MKYVRLFLQGVCLCACFFVPFQIYGQENWAWNTPTNSGLFGGRAEAGGGVYYAISKWETTEGMTVLKPSAGGSLYAGLWLTRWLLVGGEISHLTGKSQSAYFDKIRQNEAGGFIKINFTPDMAPAQYIILGVGKRFWNYDIQLLGPQENSSLYYRAVFGMEWPVWKSLLVGIQWRLTYLSQTQLGPYLHVSSQWENAPALYLSLQF